jgi:3-hydroxyacyl-CoA dehydrogenase/enoyl-CoA hydratase/3-hydroxybutyryl-CoA epimerase
MSDFTKTHDADGIATITWDCYERPMNVMSEQGFFDLDVMVDDCLADETVKGVIITSAKSDFAAGMDLSVIAQTKEKNPENPAQGCFEMVTQIHRILRKIELAGMDFRTKKGGKPFVAVLPGTALGIGLEIPLACHHIIAADNPKAKIGLPEIKVGIFPGAGGTTRLVRKLGAMGASAILLEGKLNNPSKAKAAGIIDAVSMTPMDDAKAWILAAKDADLVKVWDAKGYKMPGGTPYHPAGFMTFVGASAMVNGNTMGVYPAAKALLSAVYEGALVPFDTALKIETRHFTSVLVNPSSSNMIRSLFINKGALEKGAVRPAGLPDQTTRKVGVVGAGMMGAGIALVSAQAGIEVVLIDQKQESADKGKAYVEAYCDKGIARKKTTAEQKEALLNNITATADYKALSDCDLIIEAVFEDPSIKATVTKVVEAIIPEDCIFATNTSTLPISDLAKSSVRPVQFIGIHFFSPVEKMLLVEIIKGKNTGDRAVAKALDYVRQIRKTPIVVNDARFFYANRCIIPYINEGIRMVKEGVEPALIENAAKLMGMPLGPLQLNDETSIDLGVKIAKATKAAMAEAYDNDEADEVLFWLFDQGRLGRKSAAGFYEYDARSKRVGIWQGLRDQYTKDGANLDLLEVQHRLMFAQTLEAVRALEDGVLMDVREGDVGAILGWGFAPWTGGPLSWFDMLGASYAVARCNDLEASYGPRFKAPDLLLEMAEEGDGFYSRFAA